MKYAFSKRYHLRSYRDSDVDALVKYANSPKVTKYLREHFPQPYTHADAEAWIRHVRGRDPETILAIATEDELIGNVGLYLQEDVYRNSAELGYWVGEPYWGRGVATGAVCAICDIAFSRSDLMKIFACVFEPNVGSWRVLEKCGFSLEGVHRKAVVKAGRTFDEKVYGLLREEWREERKNGRTEETGE